jgi:uncharacterized protein YjbI with pentapeptide repeats
VGYGLVTGREVLTTIVVLILVLILVLIWVVYKRLTTRRWPDWTGFGEYIGPEVPQNQKFQRAKTLWDWMQLLIIPVVLAGGVYWLNESARQSEQAIADQRAQIERNIASDNIQETALQTYLDRMTELLLDKKLRESENNSEVRAVARARTLTVLRRLGGDRKGALLRFLYEADLLHKDKIVIDLRGADLSEVGLSETDLSGANLRGAHLSETNLGWANLFGANLIFADLFRANLSEANLSKAGLRGTDLSEADLTGADLTGAKYTKNSEGIRDTIWPEGFDPDAAGAIRVKR